MIGETIGGYRIIAKLGEGGMGTVYRGEHRWIARQAAIKVLLPELSKSQDVVRRFFNEARATSLIRHPGIVEVLDCDVLPAGNAYIVMELLEGETLGSRLRRGGRIPAPEALFLTRRIADALVAAHERGIVHRDLKPDNVFLLAASADVPAAAEQPIKIVDFGIAKLMHQDDAAGRYKTRTGSLLGTPVYMSPEQCRGTGLIDHRTDIYSLGCVLFEALCGRPPFVNEGFGELIQAHLSTVPPALRSIDATLPPALEVLVARLLAKSPDDRPQTMRGLCAELDALAAGGFAPPPPARAATEVLPVAPPAAAGATMPYDAVKTEAPTSQTTLRSASSEMLASSDRGGDAAGTRFRISGWARIATVAVAAVVVGGVGIWRIAPRRGADVHAGGAEDPPASEPPAAGPPPAPTPTPPVTIEPGPARPVVPPEDQPTPIVAPPPAPTPAVPVPVPVPVPAPAPRKVKVVISSQPSGADVCLASNRILLGKTRLDWNPEKGSRTVKLLLRKPGYRGQEVTVSLGGDAKAQATLPKLGPDDIDDTVNCKRR